MLKGMMEESGQSPEDCAMAEAILKGVAVGIWQAQQAGFIRFPVGPLDVEGIEYRLDLCAGVAVRKILSLKPPKN